MKKLLLGMTALVAVSSTAMAQEAAAPAPSLTNAYVGVSTSLEGTADWTLGSEINLSGLNGYGELKYKDRVDAAGDPADDYVVTLGSKLSVAGLGLKTGVSYEWGATSGADLIGRGAGNTWGDLTSNTEFSVSPGVIGGEFVWLGATMNLASAGEIDLGWGGANYGFGYKHDLNERASISASYGWNVSVVDDGDDTTVNDWVTESTGLKLGVGFKF
tara:strand:+ start:1649 stop:2296 length:648 start_codon:yes stop_codon:yes gene_type:complete